MSAAVVAAAARRGGGSGGVRGAFLSAAALCEVLEGTVCAGAVGKSRGVLRHGSALWTVRGVRGHRAAWWTLWCTTGPHDLFYTAL